MRCGDGCGNRERTPLRHASVPRTSPRQQPWNPVLPAALAVCLGATGRNAPPPRYNWIDASAPEQHNREQVKIESGVIRVQEQL